MIRLYYRPESSGRPMRVAWMLEELGVEYDVTAVSDTDSAEHRKRHPLGRVPVLELDDGSMLFDSTAILLTLADLHPDAGFLPPPGSVDRGLAYEWTLTAMTELETAAIAYIRHGDDDARAPIRTVLAAFGDAIEGHEFIAGDRLGVADIVTVGVLFACELRQLVSDEAPPVVREYFRRLGSRPALARAAERTESLLQPAALLGA